MHGDFEDRPARTGRPALNQHQGRSAFAEDVTLQVAANVRDGDQERGEIGSVPTIADDDGASVRRRRIATTIAQTLLGGIRGHDRALVPRGYREIVS